MHNNLEFVPCYFKNYNTNNTYGFKLKMMSAISTQSVRYVIDYLRIKYDANKVNISSNYSNIASLTFTFKNPDNKITIIPVSIPIFIIDQVSVINGEHHNEIIGFRWVNIMFRLIPNEPIVLIQESQ